MKMASENDKSTKEANLLLHDRSTKMGSIYFIGLSSKFYGGKMIIKKNIITDKVVRRTNLNENLSLIENGSFNIKQTAILIKGVTVFLHRQVEVLISDLHLLYRKFFLHTEKDFKQIVKRIKKDKNRNAIKKKILTLQDINTNTNNMFLNPPNFLNENKNVADTTDLTLKGTPDIFNTNYKLDNLERFQAFNESDIPHNLFDDISSFNNSKIDNIFTLNNSFGNLFSKDLMEEVKNYNAEEMNISLKMMDSSLNTSNNELNPFISFQKAENKNPASGFFHMSFFPEKPKENNTTMNPISWEEIGKMNNLFEKDYTRNENLHFSFSQHMSERANTIGNNLPSNYNNNNINNNTNKRNMKKTNDKKKSLVEIDEVITLTKHAWDETKPILLKKCTDKQEKKDKKDKKEKTLKNFKDELFYKEHILFHLVQKDGDGNKKKDSDFSPFYNFYKITKNYDYLDTRKELFNLMVKYVETENKFNTDKSCHNEMKRKLYYNALNTDSSIHSANDFYFEQLRENFTEQNFRNLDELHKHKKQKTGNEFLFSVSSVNIQEPNFQFDFDNSINDSQYERRDQMKISDDEEENYIKYKNLNSYSDANNLISKENSKNSTLVDSLKDSLEVPSSKLMNRRSSTSSPIYKYDSSLLRLKTYIDKFCSTETVPLVFEIICPLKKVNYRNAAITFYNLLVLASNDEIKLLQGGPQEKIIIKLF